MPEASGATDQGRTGPLGLRIAALVCWCWAAVVAVYAIVLLTLALRTSPPDTALLMLGGVGVLVAGGYGYVARGIGRRSSAAFAALAITGFLGVLQAVSHRPGSLAGLSVNALIFVLVATNWRAAVRPLG